jgi:hypothetical protein
MTPMKMRSTLKVGDWVEVRSKEEILATLDAHGRLEGMPFMPEMFHFCGQTLRVQKRAHKSCDYTTPHPFKSRWVDKAVLLDTRCDGSGHDGCQAGCTILWKEGWLRPVEGPDNGERVGRGAVSAADASPAASRCSEHSVWQLTHVTEPDGARRYVCQMTALPQASTPLHWWDLRQYVEDYVSGNVPIGSLISGTIYAAYYSLSQAGIGIGRPMRAIYNACRGLWRGSRFPRTPGVIPEGSPTPVSTLNLQPGELVRVRPHDDILQTVTTGNLNRGMHWDAELVPYCGGTYRVLSRVHQLIDEKTARMVRMKTAGIVLDTVVCQARYSSCRMFCPRAMYPYWREIWLERVAANEETPRVAGTGS